MLDRQSWKALGVVALMIWSAGGFGQGLRAESKSVCRRAVVEGEVKAGQSIAVVFAKGLEFRLEAIQSGWIVRVLPVGVPRGDHDWAELATPPYKSVTPLAVSTDFAFRAQDAVGWNPRRFRYAKDAATADGLLELYPKVLANDPAAMGKVAKLTEEQPGAELRILNATIAPGGADQWRMAAAVASHFAETPHEVEQNAGLSPLGKLEKVQFRVKLEMMPGIEVSKGVSVEKYPCAAQPSSAQPKSAQLSSTQPTR